MQQFNTLKNERLEKRTKLAKIQKEKYIKKRVCVEIVCLIVQQALSEKKLASVADKKKHAYKMKGIREQIQKKNSQSMLLFMSCLSLLVFV